PRTGRGAHARRGGDGRRARRQPLGQRRRVAVGIRRRGGDGLADGRGGERSGKAGVSAAVGRQGCLAEIARPRGGVGIDVNRERAVGGGGERAVHAAAVADTRGRREGRRTLL